MCGLFADRDLHANSLRREPIEDARVGTLEGCSRAIELVDEADTRHLSLVGITPVGLGLRLHARDTVEDDDSTVKHAHRALHFSSEIDMSRRVDNIETEFLRRILLVLLARLRPETGDSGGGDGDAAFALLFHPVGGRLALMHLADLVLRTRIEKDALAGGRLPRVNVRDDAEIAYFLERIVSVHKMGKK